VEGKAAEMQQAELGKRAAEMQQDAVERKAAGMQQEAVEERRRRSSRESRRKRRGRGRRRRPGCQREVENLNNQCEEKTLNVAALRAVAQRTYIVKIHHGSVPVDAFSPRRYRSFFSVFLGVPHWSYGVGVGIAHGTLRKWVGGLQDNLYR